MTRKDFQLVATVVSSIDNIKTRNQVALNFVSELHKQNERFDTIRFLSACKVDSNEASVGPSDDYHLSRERFIAP
tara:strand:- start:3724 stop:3948 length:225 start_codon:yes stop_codon:yes gene_type:complete